MNWDELQADVQRRRKAGEAVGIGLGMFVEKSGLGPFDGVRVTIDTGLSGGSGSGSVTSITAPARCPLCSAATRSSVTTSGPRATLTSSAPALHLRQFRGIDDSARRIVQRQAQHDDVDRGQQVVQPIGRPKGFDAVRLVDRKHVGGEDADVKGGQQLGQPPADAAEAHDAHRAARQVAGGPADELLLLLGAEERGQAAAPAGHQRDRVLGHLIGQHARGAGDGDVRLDHRRHQAMVHAGGRRLDPPQAALPDHAVPIDRHLGVAAEDVGPEQLFGDPLLAGVDDLGLRHGGGDLLDVFGFDGVAEDDSRRHGGQDGVNVAG